jgi:hypothetical protein
LYFASEIETVVQIDAAVIRSKVLRGLEQPAPPGLVTSLSEMRWTTLRARSPIDDTIELLTPRPISAITEVIAGSRWCFGPKAGTDLDYPAWLRCSNSHVTTALSLDVRWDLWVDYPPGRAMIDAGIARVLDRPGWEARQVYPPT